MVEMSPLDRFIDLLLSVALVVAIIGLMVAFVVGVVTLIS